ncbi:hypothetical protein J437_LFUL011273 [Ladona fulva]|uniref:Uncharacterized protein n=1 Tax=Ladona fulva TaxID=123851 RepID=A0A8K0P607_LADFU|nr:hypothetical protein J437_LFUL011273 [Ladona fulva]
MEAVKRGRFIQATDNRATDKRATDNRTKDNRATDNRVTDNRTKDNRVTDNRTIIIELRAGSEVHTMSNRKGINVDQ